MEFDSVIYVYMAFILWDLIILVRKPLTYDYSRRILRKRLDLGGGRKHALLCNTYRMLAYILISCDVLKISFDVNS